METCKVCDAGIVEKMGKRDKTIDILKGTAIILMVLGHVIQTIYAPDNYDENLIFKFIYSFHMPLFIFISGYLTGMKQEFSIRWILDRTRDAILSLCGGVMIPFMIGRICERYVPFVASILFGRKK